MVKRKPRNEKRLYESLKKLDTGDGVFISVGNVRGNNVSTRYIYGIESRPLTINQNNTARKLRISFDSMENENRELLHFLFQRTR